jgi:hypothetical protein
MIKVKISSNNDDWFWARVDSTEWLTQRFKRIIIETWLDPTISSYEYFPQDRYTIYRTDRPPNKQGLSHGIGEEQACGFPGLSISLRAWYVLFVEKEDNPVW